MPRPCLPPLAPCRPLNRHLSSPQKRTDARLSCPAAFSPFGRQKSDVISATSSFSVTSLDSGLLDVASLCTCSSAPPPRPQNLLFYFSSLPSAARRRFQTTQLSPVRLSLPLSRSLGSKLRRAAWRCVTSPMAPANPVMAVISPRQHPPPPSPLRLLHLSLCGRVMSSFQLLTG